MIVYWLYDDTCSDVLTDGYVGVTEKLETRIKQHRRRFSDKNFNAVILYEGSKEECYSKENELRPTKGIGWNLAIGGKQGYTLGTVASDKRKVKISKAMIGNKNSIGTSKLKGRKRKELSLKLKGRIPWNKNLRMNEEYREKCKLRMMGKANPNINVLHEIQVCPHCQRSFKRGMFARWHGDKCKMRCD